MFLRYSYFIDELGRLWTLAVLMSLSTCGVHEFCREKVYAAA